MKTNTAKLLSAKDLLSSYIEDVRNFANQGHNPHYVDSMIVTEAIMTFATILHKSYGFGANLYGQDFCDLHQALCADLVTTQED